MNAPHWHLAINHLPVMGVLLFMILLGSALLLRRPDWYGVCLGFFALLALATVAVFFTGRRADDALMEIADVDEKVVRIHETAATIAFIGMGVLGTAAIAGLWCARKLRAVQGGWAAAVFVLAVVETLLLARTANLGGQIRHPEIRHAAAGAGKSEGKKGDSE